MRKAVSDNQIKETVYGKNQSMMIIILIAAIVNPVSSFFPITRNHSQLDRIDYVLSVTEVDDLVYDGNIEFNLFRKDIDFFWFSPVGLATYKAITDYGYNIYELIDRYRPKVISDFEIGNMDDKRIRDNYRQDNKYEDLFIRTADKST